MLYAPETILPKKDLSRALHLIEQDKRSNNLKCRYGKLQPFSISLVK